MHGSALAPTCNAPHRPLRPVHGGLAGIAIVGWLDGARSRARGFPPTFGLGQHCRNWTRARFSSALQRSVTRVTDPCLLRTTSFTPKLVWLMLSPAHAAHRSTRRRTIAVVLRTSSTRSSRCCGKSVWLPSTSASAAIRCREGGGRRLHDDAVVARFRRVVCGARHARRWWGQKLWIFEASWGSSSGSRGLS